MTEVVMTLGTLLILGRILQLQYRLKKQNAAVASSPQREGIWTGQSLSIIIPVRNEEKTLPLLLPSLQRQIDELKASGLSVEVIVVNDHSDDQSVEVAKSFAPLVEVIDAPPKPRDWGGKQWACHWGSQKARGNLLLFIDADIVFDPGGLSLALHFFQSSELKMLSAIPRHLGDSWWERGTAFFQSLVLFSANGLSTSHSHRAYCVGQFILLDRNTYQDIGGHEAVRKHLAEDVPMAKNALRLGYAYDAYVGGDVFGVRMYDRFGDFVRGWRRNFRAGLKESSPMAGLEAALVVCTLIGAGAYPPSFISGLLWTAAVLICLPITYRYNSAVSSRIKKWPTLLCSIPLSLMVFVFITILAVSDRMRARPVIWKGRAIQSI